MASKRKDNNNNNNYDKTKIKYTIEDILVDFNLLEDKYMCEICTGCVFKDLNKIEAFQCKEGHVFCTSCWTQSLARKKECMACRAPCEFNTLSKNILLQKDFREKRVYCPNIYRYVGGKIVKDERFGCKMIFSYDELESHLKNCPKEFIECPFNKSTTSKELKCQSIIRKSLIYSHQEICVLTIGVCTYCQVDLGKKEILKEHQEKTCQKYLVKCTQECKNSTTNFVMVERGNLQNHIKIDCPKTKIQCKYIDGGCTEVFQRCDQVKHLNDVNHSVYIQNIMDQQFKASQEMVAKLTLENQELQKKLDQYSIKIDQLELKYNTTNSLLTQVKENLGD
ncbi:hypothetical protein DICPUDRAFT_31748, partial [Dictyostelium purpureum]